MQHSDEYTVLVVEDEPLVRESLAAFLEDSGFGVLEADNGETGLKVIQEQKPDAILCDLHMPVMDGLALLKKLNELKIDIPFIVVSGASVIHDAVDALHLGAWDYIIKPITDMGTLEHAVNRSLDRKRLLIENERYREELENTNLILKQSLHVLEEDQAAGRTVQFSLLPDKEVQYEIYNFKHCIIPSLYLSGDFIDYFQIDERYLGFYIADVSGHGAPSAFVTVLLHSLIGHVVSKYKSTEEDDVIAHPEKLLKYISTEILKAKFGKYLTMVYGLIDLKDKTLSYSIGGHYPNPIYMQEGEKPYFLEGSGFPVGVFERAEYQLYTIDIAKPFHLAMFSDGVLEILPVEGLEAQENKLLSLVEKTNASKDAILSELSLKENDNQELPDDVTFLIVSGGS